MSASRAGARLRDVTLLLPAAAAVVVVWWLTREGIGLSPDSAVYRAVALSLRDGAGLSVPDGRAYVEQPPLLSALLALLALLGPTPEAAARAVNALALGVTVGLTGLLVRRLTGVTGWGLAAAIAVLAAPPLLTSALWLWSEPLFTALLLGCVVALDRDRARPSTRLVVLAGLLAAVAALTRYLGLALVPAVVAVPLFDSRRSGAARLRDAVLGGIAALGPPLLWLARNLVVSGAATGDRFPSAEKPGMAAFELLDTLGRWLGLGGLPLLTTGYLIAAVVAGVAVWYARCWWEGDEPPPLLAPIVAAGSLTAYLLIAATRYALDPIDDRLVAPLLPLLIAVGGVCLHGLTLWPRDSRRRFVGPVVSLLVALWLGWSVLRAGALMGAVAAQPPGGYAGPRWRASPALAALRARPPDAPLLSNDPFAIWTVAGLPAALSPRRYPYRSPLIHVADLDRLAARVAAGERPMLLWFEGVPRDFLLDPAALSARLQLELVSRYDDATLYRVRPR